MNQRKVDINRVTDKILSRVKVVSRHPRLMTHFYENGAELSRRHVSIELRRAQSIYSLSVVTSLDETVRLYRKEIICYGKSFLYAICRNLKPHVVIETGVQYGASSAFILQALCDNNFGHLYSIDLPDVKYIRDNGKPHHDSIKPNRVGTAVPNELRGRWTLIIGNTKEKLPELLGTLESIDVFFHDSMHTYDHMYLEYKTAWSKLRTGGLLVSDDVLWNTAFLDFCHEKGVEPHVVEDIGFAQKRHNREDPIVNPKR
jgi:predicted O-methyltransferase YrrM